MSPLSDEAYLQLTSLLFQCRYCIVVRYFWFIDRINPVDEPEVSHDDTIAALKEERRELKISLIREGRHVDEAVKVWRDSQAKWGAISRHEKAARQKAKEEVDVLEKVWTYLLLHSCRNMDYRIDEIEREIKKLERDADRRDWVLV